MPIVTKEFTVTLANGRTVTSDVTIEATLAPYMSSGFEEFNPELPPQDTIDGISFAPIVCDDNEEVLSGDERLEAARLLRAAAMDIDTSGIEFDPEEVLGDPFEFGEGL